MLKKQLSVILGTIVSIFAVMVFPIFSATATTTDDTISVATYDLNEDGLINCLDVLLMKKAVLTGDKSIIDFLNLKRSILKNESIQVVPAVASTNCDELEVNDDNSNFIKNIFGNVDAQRSVIDDTDKGVYINFLCLDEQYIYTLEFNNGYTSLPANQYDLVVRFTDDGVTRVIWTDSNKYYIAIETYIDLVDDYTDCSKLEVNDENTNFILKEFTDVETLRKVTEFDNTQLIIEFRVINGNARYTLVFTDGYRSLPSEDDDNYEFILRFIDDGVTRVIWTDSTRYYVSIESK